MLAAVVLVAAAASTSRLRVARAAVSEDRNSAHRWGADKSFLLPAAGTPVGAYLSVDSIIDVAVKNGVDAIHPGYGFLSEAMRSRIESLSHQLKAPSRRTVVVPFWTEMMRL